MQPAHPIRTDLVLLGAGPAHLEVLRRFALRGQPGLRLTLVSREPETPYPAMLPGLVRGDYRPAQAQVDLAPLTAAAGARLILAEATGLDPQRQQVAIAGRPPLPYDLLSLDLPGPPPLSPGAGIAAPPAGRLLDQLARLETSLPRGARLAVLGGCAASTALALALVHRLGGRARIVLVSDTAEPVADAPARARQAIRAALVDAGVELISGVRAIGLAGDRLQLSDGSTVEATQALWAAGAGGAPFLAQSGLACDDAGRVRVERTLQSISHPGVFAAGHCATPKEAALSPNGVRTIRAGAPLAGNLRRAAMRQPLCRWRPRQDALASIGLGEDRAVAWRNGLTLSGHAVWRCKDWLDRRRVRLYQQPPTPAAAPHRADATQRGAAALAAALAEPPAAAAADGLNGLDLPDDAAALVPPPGHAVVQGIAHLRAQIDDPFVFGQVAAAHALADLHAMGARPWRAVATAALPGIGSPRMRAELATMLRGAAAVLQADGCCLAGVHDSEASEPMLGFAVAGLADPRRLLRQSGLRPGDALLLTKPLGTGILLAGHRLGQAKAAWLLAAQHSMCRSDAAAARLLLAHGATACTKVAHLGLAGHLLPMLHASGVAGLLWPELLPALPGARGLAARGIAGSRAPDTLPGPVATAADIALLTDPQIAGGLLAGVPEDQATACLTALHAAGIPAAHLGWVEPLESGANPLRLEPAPAAAAEAAG